MFKILVGAAVALVLAAATAQAQLADVAHFADSASARGASISPNGAYVAYIGRAGDADQVVVVDLAASRGAIVQSLRRSEGNINWIAWKDDGRILLGIEALMTTRPDHETAASRVGARAIHYSVFRVVAINRDGSGLVQMFQGEMHHLVFGYGSTELLDPLPADPTHVLIVATDNMGVGVWRGDVRSGSVDRVADGSWDTRAYATDGSGYPVLRLDVLPRGAGFRVLRRAPGVTQWTFVSDVRGVLMRKDSPDFAPVAPGPGPGQVYVVARLPGHDRSAIYLYDTATGSFGEPIYAPENVDASYMWRDPALGAFIAGCAFTERFSCRAHEASVQRHLNAVDTFFNHDATVTMRNMSADANRWLLRVESPTEAAGYFVYDRSQTRVTPITAIYPSVDLAALSPTRVVSYQSRDGTTLWAYVTARPGDGPRPMVVMPHGGPEARDYYGYDSFAQFLASRGYVVVQPNFRGSEGFGRGFAEAGYGQWGRRMQDDVSDVVRHMTEANVADPHRVCIVGASYGGYAALAGASLTPDLYRCAVAIAGVSDLAEMLRSERAAGQNSISYQYWLTSIGDPGADHDALAAASPRLHAAAVTAPVLLIHGEDDDVVPIRQSELMQQALASAGHPARLVRIPEEGHYWDEWSSEHRLMLYRETEAFLAQQLSPSP